MMVISKYVITVASANKSLSKYVVLIVLRKCLHFAKTLGSV